MTGSYDPTLFDLIDTAILNLQQEAEGLAWEGEEAERLDGVQRQLDRLRQMKGEGLSLLPRF